MDHILSRRQFLKVLGASSAALALPIMSACKASQTPTPITVTRVVESTRIVEKIVEVIRIEPTATIQPTEEPGMIWYVDIEHEKALADPNLAPNFDRVRAERTAVLGTISKLPSESILYRQVSMDLAKERKVRAIAISGNTTDWIEYDFSAFQPLFEIVKSGTIPVIGLCGGHQLIGLMYNSECGPLRKLNPGEADPANFAPGWYKEVGYTPVTVVKADPLFTGLNKEPVFFESHYWEIKQLPAEFELLASTENCKIQVMRHKQYPIYGTQFHPEVNSIENRDGLTLLTNFFRTTGVLKG